jgi:cob(I)alamin adenosyltransferase
MTVNLTRIYTKLGDAGETHLGDMSRVSKLHPRVQAYGTVDELNATLGLALVQPGLPERVSQWLGRVQNDLLDVGADLSVPDTPEGQSGQRPERTRLRVTPAYTQWLEQACDEVNAELAPLRTFVIPGGTAPAAYLHLSRTVCRRAERQALAIGESCNPETLRYLNRLSDLLFILARAVNEGVESLWKPGAHTPAADSGQPRPAQS